MPRRIILLFDMELNDKYTKVSLKLDKKKMKKI